MNFNEARKLAKALQESKAAINDMVEIMGTMAVNHFVKSFRNQGFTDEHLERWEKRKGEFSGMNVRKRIRKKVGRAILVKTGALRRSIRKVRKGQYSVMIKSDLPYAAVHNYGLRSGRGAGFMMPKREFVGNSGTLSRAILARFDRKIRNIFR